MFVGFVFCVIILPLNDAELSCLLFCGTFEAGGGADGGQYVFRGTATQPERSPSLLDLANSKINFPSAK